MAKIHVRAAHRRALRSCTPVLAPICRLLDHGADSAMKNPSRTYVKSRLKNGSISFLRHVASTVTVTKATSTKLPFPIVACHGVCAFQFGNWTISRIYPTSCQCIVPSLDKLRVGRVQRDADFFVQGDFQRLLESSVLFGDERKRGTPFHIDFETLL
jgi:hypothetical protein